MTRRPGRSFALLVGAGAGLEVIGVGAALLGLDTIGRCDWAWLPGPHNRFPRVCTTPIVGVGYHLFVPVVLLVALVCASALLGGLHAVRMAKRVAQLSSDLGAPVNSLPEEVAAAALQARALCLEVRRHEVPFAVCIGMRRPRLVVSTALVALLGPDELVAVLVHEERHRRRRAPLRRLLGQATVRGLFFIPVLHDLLDAHLLDEEVVADRDAASLAGRRPLVAALEKLATAASFEGASAFAEVASLSARLRALATGSNEALRFTLRRVAGSAASLGALALVIAWMPLVKLH